MVILGDAVEKLLEMSKGSVDLVLSDLPSGETRARFDRKSDLSLLFPAIWRALKVDGIAVLMASSLKFAQELVQADYGSFRYELIWHKSNATGYLNARHRPLRSHEYILVFSRRLGVYNPQMSTGASPIHAARRTHNGDNYGISVSTDSRAGATDRYPTSVLEFASVGTSAKERVHPQQKPVALMRWLIETYSRPGELVVDPYAGSGTVEKAASLVGRRSLCFDNDIRFAQPVR